MTPHMIGIWQLRDLSSNHAARLTRRTSLGRAVRPRLQPIWMVSSWSCFGEDCPTFRGTVSGGEGLKSLIERTWLRTRAPHTQSTLYLNEYRCLLVNHAGFRRGLRATAINCSVRHLPAHVYEVYWADTGSSALSSVSVFFSFNLRGRLITTVSARRSCAQS